MKKELTSVDVAAITCELKKKIIDAYINNVYQINRKTILLKLRKKDAPALQLVIEAGKRMHITSYSIEKPKKPPAFCMALRKYVKNGRLVSVEQHEFERIVTFKIAKKKGEMKLVIELFGDGNIILVDEQNRILQALTYKRMRDRNVLRGEKFQYPPSSGKNLLEINRKDFAKLREFGKMEVVRALTRFLSIGGIYAEEILLRAEINKKTHCEKLGEEEINKIFNASCTIASRLKEEKFEPCIVFDDEEKLLDVTPFPLKIYKDQKHQTYRSFSEALDDFYTKLTVIEKEKETIEKIGKKLEKEKARLERIIEKQKEALLNAKEKAEKYRRIGDLIYTHLNELQTLIGKVLKAKNAGESWEKIISKIETEKEEGLQYAKFFKSLDRKNLILNVCVENVCFGIDLRLDLFANAAKFYQQAKKARLKAEGAEKALEETERKLEEFKAKIEAETFKRKKELKGKLPKKIKKREWFEKFRWFTSSEGFLVLGGKDAVTNEVLIKKYTEPTDIVLHADIVGAPFVVIKCKGKKPSEQTIKEAAEFAASFSRAWREKFGSVDVFWVHPEQLSKGGISGAYVEKGGFIVRGKRNWMRNVPLRVALGIKTENGEIKFVGGPVDAVKTKTNIYITIVPGDFKGREFLINILKSLAEKMQADMRKKVLESSVEVIRPFIPFGMGQLAV
ncbi:NFACT family protein [Candidatus Bathyarchaeota archaeon]|nr:NFACT family protein [Candidatus Bathyarchaeota archaeon]